MLKAPSVPHIDRLHVALFADGADLDGIRALAADKRIRGFTTNPTLMRKAGISDYAGFASQAIEIVGDRPISFEVFADDFATMEVQAREIASWGPNVNVKIPVTNSAGQPTYDLIARLAAEQVQVNVTAVFTLEQVGQIAQALSPSVPAIVSVFAGRIADTGVDPVPLMREAKAVLAGRPEAKLLWASPRELLNLFHAEEAGADIITMTHDLLAKLSGVGKDLATFSLETVQMFRRDAIAAGYEIIPRAMAAAAHRAAE
jgi:transaldolase